MFNSNTLTGRANVGKATYAAIALGYFIYRLGRKPPPPPPPPAPPEDSTDKCASDKHEGATCGCGCGKKIESDDNSNEGHNDFNQNKCQKQDNNVSQTSNASQTHSSHPPPTPNLYDAEMQSLAQSELERQLNYKSIQLLLNSQLEPEELLLLRKQQERMRKSFAKSQLNTKILNDDDEVKQIGLLELIKENLPLGVSAQPHEEAKLETTNEDIMTMLFQLLP